MAPKRWTGQTVVRYASDLVVLLIPVAAAWSILIPALTLKHARRPGGRRVWTRPGLSACLAALAGWGWGLGGYAVAFAIGTYFPVRRPVSALIWLQSFFDREVLMYPGVAVAAVWAVQWLGGRWRSTADAADLLGRLVGVAWLVVGAAWTLREYLDLL